MTDRFSPPERRVAIALLVVTALGALWNTIEELKPPPPPLRLIRGALRADSTAIFDLNGLPEGIVYSSGEAELAGPIDLGTADEETLTLLPGIGPVLARRIAEWRNAREGPWQVDDLIGVSGIGPARLAQLKPLVTVGAITSETTARAESVSTGPAGSEPAARAGPDSTGSGGQESTGSGGQESTGSGGQESTGSGGRKSTDPQGPESTGRQGLNSTDQIGPERPETGVNGVDHPRGGHYDTARLSRGAHPRNTGAARKRTGLSGGLL